MTTTHSIYTEIRIRAATLKGPFRVDTGAGSGRALAFPTLAKARAFVDGFECKRLTVQIGRPLPDVESFMR